MNPMCTATAGPGLLVRSGPAALRELQATALGSPSTPHRFCSLSGVRPTAAWRALHVQTPNWDWRTVRGQRTINVMTPDEVAFVVDGWPPAKNEAKSMLAAGHPHAERVLHLLQAAAIATGTWRSPTFGSDALGLKLIVRSPAEPPSDATNYLGGVGDVLEVKERRGALGHLGELSDVALYLNDRQIQEVHYRWERASAMRYSVRVWRLCDT